MKCSHVRNNQLQIGIAFYYLNNAFRCRNIILFVWIRMNCNGYVLLLRQCENRIIVLVIQGDLSIIGVDFDTVQAITVNGFYDCIYGLCWGIACVDVSKGIELVSELGFALCTASGNM